VKTLLMNLGCLEISLQIVCHRPEIRRIRQHWIGSRQHTERLRRRLLEAITRRLTDGLTL
jgi:hypothetical protein